MKYYLLIILLFTLNTAYSQSTIKHDFNKLNARADSVLIYKLGECVFKKHVSLKNIEIIRDEREFTYRIPDRPHKRTQTIKSITYLLTYSFSLKKYEIGEIEIYFDANGNIQRGGPIDYFSEDRNTEENCYLLNEGGYRNLEKEIRELHKDDALLDNSLSYKIAIYKNKLVIKSNSFLDAENILITYHSLESGKLLFKEIRKFMT